jgi:hypothetical protein
MLRHAFKEWAVVCWALAEGRQALILRKGGIAEEGGVFRPEHERFWLFPTYVHQQREGIKAEALPLLQAAESDRPPAGVLRLSHFAEVTGVFFVERLDTALALDRLHIWSPETVMKRFAYRESGLYLLAVRIQRVPKPFDVALKPEYDGCKTWVDLGDLRDELPIDGATPVIDSRHYGDFLEELDGILHPRAYA